LLAAELRNNTNHYKKGLLRIYSFVINIFNLIYKYVNNTIDRHILLLKLW
jgi:hypothetical protein